MYHILIILYSLFVGGSVTGSKSTSPLYKTVKNVAVGTKVVLLGTGTPFADPDRSGPSVAIIVNEQSYIFDCGAGMVRRAAAAAIKYKLPSLRPENLKRLFITHLHSDHTIGYPDIYLSPAVLGRSVPLSVTGPPGIKKMHQLIREAYHEDINTRLYGAEKGNPVAYTANVSEIEKNGIIFKDENVTITAFKVIHGSWENAYGYKIQTPDKSIVISGDCTYSESMIQYAAGSDILIHEVYSIDGWNRKPPVAKKYHSAFHTSSEQLAEISRQVNPGLLVLYHQLVWDSSDAILLKEITDRYKGKVISGTDLLLIE